MAGERIERVPKRFRIPRIDPTEVEVTSIYERRPPGRFVQRVKEWINRESLNLISGITDDMRDRIAELLREGEEKGRSVAATASTLLKTGLDRGIFRSARKRA